jgi:exosortase
VESNAMTAGQNYTSRRLLIFAILIPTLLLFLPSLQVAAKLALRDDRYLQIAAGPLMCLFLIFQRRAEIFLHARYSPRTGTPLLAVAILVGVLSVYGGIGNESTILPAAMLALVLAWMAAFVLCYGVESFRKAVYPLSCLFLMIPLPAAWMDRVATGLQHGSATLSYELLKLSGVPVYRSGTVFSLPRLDFEVAPECSGIRSSLAMLTVAIIAGYIYLRSGWARWMLILFTIPIALLKNAVRITVISILGAYVDRAFVDGPFHHRYGGLVFTVVGVVLFVAALAGLQRIENWRPARRAVAVRF